MKKAALYLSLVLLGACAVKPSPLSLELQAARQARLKEAALLLSQENYLAFKKAFRLYADLSAQPGPDRTIAQDYLKACLLLGVREKDLGIVDRIPLDTASRLITADPKLSRYKPLLEVARVLSPESKGIMGDVNPEAQWYFDRPDDLSKLVLALDDRSRTDRVAAYILADFEAQFEWFIQGQKGGLKIEDPIRFHPSSLLLRFVKATKHTRDDPKPLQDILEADPSCLEVRYFLGNVSLARGNLLEAESHYAAAWEALPESPQVAISLAGVAFAEEEFERSIDFYEKTLALMPDYREAILGQAVSLTYLGRNAEAMTLLGKLLSLGNYFTGEAHFWLAWNLNDLGRFTEAQEHIEQAKKLLGQGQVFALSGIIALGLGQDERAKADFLEALTFSASDAESLLNLGAIFARQHVWDRSAAYCQKAGEAFAAQALALRDKLAEIRTSALPEARKARLVQRKSAQYDQAQLSGATAFYNAGAAYCNAGDPDRAGACLLKAASHPALKDKAEELRARIKSHS